MPNRTVSVSQHYKNISETMHQVNALLIAVGQSGPEMDNGDVMAAIGGIKALTFSMSEALEKVGDLEVNHD